VVGEGGTGGWEGPWSKLSDDSSFGCFSDIRIIFSKSGFRLTGIQAGKGVAPGEGGKKGVSSKTKKTLRDGVVGPPNRLFEALLEPRKVWIGRVLEGPRVILNSCFAFFVPVLYLQQPLDEYDDQFSWISAHFYKPET